MGGGGAGRRMWVPEYGGKEMERVSEYKYVGVVVTEDGKWTRAARRVREKAGQRSEEMQWWLGRHWGVSPKVKVEVWRLMVGSALRYGSEVWFPLVVEEQDLESVQLRYLKDVLRVQMGSVDAFVRGEFGVFEVRREREKSMLVWLGRLVVMDGRRWPKKVFGGEWDIDKGRGTGVGRVKAWRTKVDELVRGYDLGEELEKLRSGGELVGWKRAVKEAAESTGVEDWRQEVRARR